MNEKHRAAKQMGLKTLFGKRRSSTLEFSEKLVNARIFGEATRQSTRHRLPV